jgi:hypothetical protein
MGYADTTRVTVDWAATRKVWLRMWSRSFSCSSGSGGSSQYVNKTFVLFDDTFEFSSDKSSAFTKLAKVFEQLVSNSEEDGEDTEDETET